MKHGAMFGLDARIALAIFGALSVISGAALYSAIQDSKATQLLTDLNEIGKAWEQYYLDTGVYLNIEKTVFPSNKVTLESKKLLVDPGINGWNGPYLPYKISSYAMKHSIYNNAHIFYHTATKGTCDGSNTCYVWTAVNGVPPELSKALDLKIDGTDDKTSGNVIYSDYTYGGPSYAGTTQLLYKYASMPGL